jgi:hypothetical protein
MGRILKTQIPLKIEILKRSHNKLNKKSDVIDEVRASSNVQTK